jgi:triacylglycerol esterase/lipase EstA (alpha/beta hydrolase family)
VALLAVTAGLVAPGVASAQTYTPVDTPGPDLAVPEATLDAALACSGDLSAADPEPVLLVPGTSLTPQHNFSWSWIPTLVADGIEWCTVELPESAMGDIQVAGEYVVHAIRSMHAEHAGEIDVLGFSQGGMLPRWALRFWPDTRAMVDDVVGIAPSNHGTTANQPPGTAAAFCAINGCARAIWQQLAGAGFLNALNSRQETFAGIDYTVVYTTADTVVVPNSDDNGSSALAGGDGPTVTNVSVQEVCPGLTNMPNQSHELVGVVSNPAYLLALRALGPAGPADDASLAQPDCEAPYMPGVNPGTVAADGAAAQQHSQQAMQNAQKVTAEPFVACYAVTPCGPPPTGGGGATADLTPVAAPTGRRAAALKKCKKVKKRKARATCRKKAKKRPV